MHYCSRNSGALVIEYAFVKKLKKWILKHISANSFSAQITKLSALNSCLAQPYIEELKYKRFSPKSVWDSTLTTAVGPAV
jgi:hypothetical protein